jgi:hypothetical protein
MAIRFARSVRVMGSRYDCRVRVLEDRDRRDVAEAIRV